MLSKIVIGPDAKVNIFNNRGFINLEAEKIFNERNENEDGKEKSLAMLNDVSTLLFVSDGMTFAKQISIKEARKILNL